MKRYIRQTTLSEVGVQGQQELSNARLLVIGCGGLGSEAAVHLAASGVGFIHLVDFDKIDETNLHRQVFYKETEVSKFKAEVLAKHISSINSSISISFDTNRINKSNIRSLVSKYDYVLDCTDDLHTKYLINDACVLENKILIYGSLHKFEGHIAVFNSKDAQGNRTTNLRDVYPEIPTENIPSCSEVGTLNPIVSIIANMQVNEVLKLVLGIGEALTNKMLIYNSLDNSQLILKLKVNDEIKLSNIWKTELYDANDCSLITDDEIELDEFIVLMSQQNAQLISLVSDDSRIPFLVNYSTTLEAIKAGELSLSTAKYVVLCNKGISSLKAVSILKNQFAESTFLSLKNGLQNFKN